MEKQYCMKEYMKDYRKKWKLW